MLAEYGGLTATARQTKIPAVLAAMRSHGALAETMRSGDRLSTPSAMRDWLRLTYATPSASRSCSSPWTRGTA